MEKDMWFICKCGYESENEFEVCPQCKRIRCGEWVDLNKDNKED